ncbi:PREDICTED: E3 ubiquitin-protein ligase MARCH8-like [Camelina sativa]|uniref:E3 ubiquitin-protein ligase MARCH8-like n=1 Tax=Camelina sativa TaxID=90675 RepID=A0ABM0WD55_CAMSA|nr:PREDICTED: E3 ubiquitin-protein ligase MARCH8-like [Camelina sativa]
MDPRSCSKSISVCENSSDVVLEGGVKGQTSDSVSKKVLIEEENDSRMAKDGVSCSSSSNISSAQAVHEGVADNVSVVSCNEAESDTSKAKAKEFHTVDLSGEGERICRICHFGSDQSPVVATGDNKSVSQDLIEIGCKCKNELGLAHLHCAEAWFKLRGNSVCEICGCTAKNITVRLMEDWSGERDNTLDERRRRGRGQSCCIFMLFLLSILLLHWFFKKFSGYYQNK